MCDVRVAKVVDNNDPDRKGKIQVRIYPELVDVDKKLLPWAEIFTNSLNGVSENSGNHTFPEKNSWVRVLIEDYPIFHRVKIISDDYVPGLYIYNKANNLSRIEELGPQTYPQPTFQFYKDGTIHFHNTETGEDGTLYGDGSYNIKDKNGNFFTSVGGKYKVYNNKGSILLDSKGNVVLNDGTDFAVSFTKLQTALTTFASNVSIAINSAAGNVPLPTPITLNISSAKVEDVKIGKSL